MGFEALLGNEQLKTDLTSARDKGRLSHFYLISGPAGSGRHTLADLIAGAMLCESPNAPCGVCPICRKIQNHLHPDYRTIDDPEKKTVPVDLIREARTDLFIRPNEGRRKIYLFPRAQDMGIPGQNALLKVLEEPPEYGVFLLIADNPAALLPTVRSRCVELKLLPIPDDILRPTLASEFPEASGEAISSAILRSGGYLGQAREILSGDPISDTTRAFARSYAEGNTVALLQVIVPMEKWKRDVLIPELKQWLELLTQALLIRGGLPAQSPEAGAVAAARNPRELMDAVQALKKAIEYAQGNVSPAAVCGWLSWQLR